MRWTGTEAGNRRDHEIKNPLNFVNNFANLSVELLDELKQTTAPAVAALGEDQRAEVDETTELLTGNLQKIAEHGRRADGIVKSMLVPNCINQRI